MHGKINRSVWDGAWEIPIDIQSFYNIKQYGVHGNDLSISEFIYEFGIYGAPSY